MINLQFTLFFTVQSSYKTPLLVGTSEVNLVPWAQMTKYGGSISSREKCGVWMIMVTSSAVWTAIGVGPLMMFSH